MSKKNVKEQDNARYYDMSKMTGKEVMEDFFAAEEEAELQEKLDEGWEDMGIYDPNAPDADEQFEVIANKILDKMECE